MDVEEYQREADCEANPEDDEANDQAHQGGDGSKVTECFRPQETRESVLLHRTKDILLLCMEHIGDLCHDAHLRLRLRLVRTTQRERVDAQGRRQVDFVVL